MKIKRKKFFKCFDVPNDDLAIFVPCIDFAPADLHTPDWNVLILLVQVFLDLTTLWGNDGNVLINSWNECFF